MQTNSNPQQPESTAASADPPELPTTAGKGPFQAASSATKLTTGKKPTSKEPARQRAATRPTAATKPDAKASKPVKAAEQAPSAKPAPTTSSGGPREGSTMWAILKVLGAATEPLSPKEIYAQIAERKLASGLKGKTPDQSVAAALAVAAKQGRYVERAAPGKFRKLKEERS